MNTSTRDSEQTVTSDRLDPIAGSTVWGAADLSDARQWTHPYEDVDAAALRRMLGAQGFAVFSGFPVENDERASEQLLAFGRSLGAPLAQNRSGDLLDLVRDEGSGTPRGAKTSRELVFHTDFATTIPDTFCLLAVRAAMTGGESLLVSGHTAYNELLRTRPDHLARLCRDYCFDRSGDTLPGDAPVFRAPVFATAGSGVTMLYNRARIHRGHRAAGEPLARADLAALDALDAILADPAHTLTFTLRPGDLMAVDNRVVLHNRKAFVDHPEPQRRRLLIRLWLRTT